MLTIISPFTKGEIIVNPVSSAAHSSYIEIILVLTTH